MSTAQHIGWRTSSYTSNGANCVEVAVSPQLVGVRDTKARDSGTLAFDAAAWRGFLAAVKAGGYDR